MNNNNVSTQEKIYIYIYMNKMMKNSAKDILAPWKFSPHRLQNKH